MLTIERVMWDLQVYGLYVKDSVMSLFDGLPRRIPGNVFEHNTVTLFKIISC